MIFGNVQELIKIAKTARKEEKWDIIFKSREPSSDEQVIHDDLLEKLTEGDPRKEQFLYESSQGRTLEQIAEELHVTTKTLRNWREKMREREKQLTGQFPEKAV